MHVRGLLTMLVKKLSSPLALVQEFRRRRTHQSNHLREMSASHVFLLLWIYAVEHVLALEQISGLVIQSACLTINA